jgi:uncharacterized membrane protein YkvA (DUF1232 family)
MPNKLQSAWKNFKVELKTYQLVLKDSRTPRIGRWLLGLAVAYAISPIDLIPDFIPLVGHLDDAVIIPLLIVLALKLTPREIIEDCRRQARSV